MLGIYCLGILILSSTAAPISSIVCFRTSSQFPDHNNIKCKHGDVLQFNYVIFGYEWMNCNTSDNETLNALRCCNFSWDDCTINAKKDDFTFMNNNFVKISKKSNIESNIELLNYGDEYYRISVNFLDPPKNNTCQDKAGYQYSYQIIEYECFKYSTFLASSRHTIPQITTSTTTPPPQNSSSNRSSILKRTTKTSYLIKSTKFFEATSKPGIHTYRKSTDSMGILSSHSNGKTGVIGGAVGGILLVVIIPVMFGLNIIIKRKIKPKSGPVVDDTRIQGPGEANRQTSNESNYEITDYEIAVYEISDSENIAYQNTNTENIAYQNTENIAYQNTENIAYQNTDSENIVYQNTDSENIAYQNAENIEAVAQLTSSSGYSVRPEILSAEAYDHLEDKSLDMHVYSLINENRKS